MSCVPLLACKQCPAISIQTVSTMHDTLDSAYVAFAPTLLALAVGIAIMVFAALAVERLLARAALKRRRLLWQAVLLSLGVLLVLELTGMGHAVSSLWFASSHSAEAVASVQADSWAASAVVDRGLTWTRRSYSPGMIVGPGMGGNVLRSPGRLGGGTTLVEVPTPPDSAETATPSSEAFVLPIVEESAEPHTAEPAAQPVVAAGPRGRLPTLAAWFLAIAWAAGACFLSVERFSPGQD